MMEELEGIMMNVQDVIDNGEDVSESQQSPDQYPSSKANNLEESSPDVLNASKKSKKTAVNLDNFSQESLFTMLELLMCLMEAE